LLTTHNDEQLIAACASNEAWAWDAIVDRHKRLVYAVALRSGLVREDAADVFQVVFIALLEHLHTLRSPQGLAAWLITTTKRESWRWLRRREREDVQPEGDVASAAAAEQWNSAGPDDSVLADQALVHAALEELHERCRALLRLLYLDSSAPSYGAISRKFGIPRGSVGPTRARCL